MSNATGLTDYIIIYLVEYILAYECATLYPRKYRYASASADWNVNGNKSRLRSVGPCGLWIDIWLFRFYDDTALKNSQ